MLKEGRNYNVTEKYSDKKVWHFRLRISGFNSGYFLGPNPAEMNTNVAAWSRLMKRVNTSASTPPPQSRKPATDAFQLAEQNDSKQ